MAYLSPLHDSRADRQPSPATRICEMCNCLATILYNLNITQALCIGKQVEYAIYHSYHYCQQQQRQYVTKLVVHGVSVPPS